MFQEAIDQTKLFCYENDSYVPHFTSVKGTGFCSGLNGEYGLLTAIIHRAILDLQSNDMRILSSSSLFISPIDLRVGYFRERTKEIHAKLRAGEFVMCATIPDGTKVNILDSTTVKGEKWHLIITESLLKPDSSLYESWQTRHIPKSRYLGWTNGIGLINRQ